MIYKVSEEEKRIRDELRELRKEFAGISAVDEFARYARTQRKINKLEDQLKTYGQSRMDERESVRWKLIKTVQIVNVRIKRTFQLPIHFSFSNFSFFVFWLGGRFGVFGSDSPV